ncbi:DUF2225 domain-containing protein [Brassicibacter mesophilus]|jgi:uncharacterized protein|uniref:DUF2225 domain-containing protein n=1 Tax=Brassicibacter mesophilus TaxID=745119 RepID=UPI003D252194
MEELYNKKIQCPSCNKEFTSSKVKSSRLRVDKRDSDLLVYYKGENPIKYSVFVCPHCGYAAQEANFNSLPQGKKDIIKINITARWYKKEYAGVRSIDDAIICNKLALYCGQLIDLKKLDLGNICLRIAWLYRMNEDNEEQRFLQYAVALFEEAFYSESLSNSVMDEVTLGYLIGELYRRIGENSVAISWFGKIVSSPSIKTNPRIEKLVREQWLMAKEDKRRKVI